MKLVLAPCGNYYHPEGQPRTKYDRVSSVCKILSGMDDGLYSAGATDGAKAAHRLITEAYAYLQTGGQEGSLPFGMSREQAAAWVMSPDVKTMADKAHGFRHGYADRGTVINHLFDTLATGGPLTMKEAEQQVGEIIDAQRERAKFSRAEHETAVELGLAKPSSKPGVMPYACLEADVMPYAHALNAWFMTEPPFDVTSLQPQVYHPKLKVAGTADALGLWGGTECIWDLKTGDGSLDRYKRAQLASYCTMSGLPGMNLMVTPERVSVRPMKASGLKRGWTDFTDCLKLYRRPGIGRDSYFTDPQARVMARESMATGAVA